MYLAFPKSLFSMADLLAVRYLWVVCNEDKCCVVTQCAADFRVASLVYVRTYCVPIAILSQNKRTRLLYLATPKYQDAARRRRHVCVEYCKGVTSPRLVPSRFSCLRDDWWEGLSDFALHQGKRRKEEKMESDWQIIKISWTSYKYLASITFFFLFLSNLLDFFVIIDYLYGYPAMVNF